MTTIETTMSRRLKKPVIAGRYGYPKTYANLAQARNAVAKLATMGVRAYVPVGWPFLVVVEMEGEPNA